MFGSEKLDALVVSMRWVADRSDCTLADGVLSKLAKIFAVLPSELRRELQESALLAGAGYKMANYAVAVDLLRIAIRNERKLQMC